ncbi:SDR family oxidoreductase [Candidatus Gottesmanbacteria bacterium]|nr:SDR family oxidoreductase [Candidatus Gottesmanbacteria bacterium]
MKKRIVVTGLHGYIGSRLAQIVGKHFELIDLNRRGFRFPALGVYKTIQADILDRELLLRSLERTDFDGIVHLAAKTHIDVCQKDSQRKERSETWQVNVEGTKNIAYISKKLGKKVIYLSTECVFDGRKGNYTEEDSPHPINFYGETKLHGEEEIQKLCSSFCIIRSVLSYGHVNYFSTDIIRKFFHSLKSGKTTKAVNDQSINPTFIDDFVNVIILSIEKNLEGIYHFAGNEIITPYQLVTTLQKKMKLPGKVISSTLRDFFKRSAKFRLKNATLSSQKIFKKINFQATSQAKIFSILSKRLK